MSDRLNPDSDIEGCYCRCFCCESAPAEAFDAHAGPVCLECALALSEVDGAIRALGGLFDYKPKKPTTHDASSSYPD